MPTDQQALQGLWRVVSCRARGDDLGSGTTHYQFDDNRVKEINPSYVDGGDWSKFELDPKARPKRFTMTSELTGRGGQSFQRVDCWLYDLQGDELRLCWPSVFGEYPDELSDKKHGVVSLVRHLGPPPETKKASGKKPIDDPVLGRVRWDDNFNHWEGRIELAAGVTVVVRIEPDEEESEEAAMAGARDFVTWLRQHEPAARRFAAEQLLDTHNDNWNEGKPISPRTFAQRMVLESVAVYPQGGGTLYYADGDLFWGHCIVVYVADDRQFKDAEIAG